MALSQQQRTLEEARKLQAWFEKQRKFSSWDALARYLGINSGSLTHIKKGRRLIANMMIRMKLYEVTRIPDFSETPDLISTRRARIQTSSAQTKSVSEYTAPEAMHRATQIQKLLTTLSSELEFFKNGSREAREILRKRVSGREVGYITSLLRALYDEDKFERWMALSAGRIVREEEV